MASQRAIVSRNGFNSQILNADTLLAGAGIDAPVAQALAVGAVNANALNLSKVGTLTTVLGNFQVNGTFSPTGGSTVTGNFTQSGGTFSLTGNGASQFSTTVGALTEDAAAALNLGNTTATAVNIGRTGVATTVNGLLVVPNSTFATVAALNAFQGGPAGVIALGGLPGTLAFVQSQRTYYSLNTATGAWDRTNAVDTQFWLAQTTFHVSDAGLADNTGLTIGSPITPAEFALRVGSSPLFTSAGTITINVHGTTVALDVEWVVAWDSHNQIVIQGDIINVGAANVISAVTARAFATGQTLRMTAPAQVYTPGQYVQITASTNPASVGAMFPIIADLTGGVAELGPGYNFSPATTVFSPSEVVPIIGDAIQTVNFTNLTGAVALTGIGPFGTAAGLSRMIFQFFITSGTGGSKLQQIVSPTNGKMVLNCVANACVAFGLDNAPHLINTCNRVSGSWANKAGAGIQALVIGGVNLEPANFQVNGPWIFQGGFTTLGTLNAGGLSNVQINEVMMSSQATAGRTLLKATDNGRFVLANTAIAISFNVVAAGIIIANLQSGQIISDAGSTWTAQIVTNGTQAALPFLIGSQTAICTFTPATGTWSVGPVNVTLANLDAALPGGFGRKCFDPRSGSGIFHVDVQ